MCTSTTEHGSSLITDNGVIPNCLYNIKPKIFSGCALLWGLLSERVNEEVMTSPLHILKATQITAQPSLRLSIAPFCVGCPASHCR